MDNFQGNFMSALQGGYQFGQQIKQQRDQQNINQLAGQAYGAPEEQRPQLLGQMAGINPQAAREQQKSFEMDDERRNRSIVNMAKMLVNAPEQARPGLWQSFVPALPRLGMTEFPTVYDSQTAPLILQTAESVVKAYGDAQGAERAPRVVGSALVDAEGKVLYQAPEQDEYQWSDRAGAWIPKPKGKGGTPEPTKADMEGDIVLANDMIAAGIPEEQVNAFLASRGQRAQAAPQPQAAPLAAIPVAGIGPRVDEPPEESYGQPQAVTAPDGTVRYVQFGNRGGRREVADYAPPPTDRDAKPPTEGERSAAGYLQRMQAAEQRLGEIQDAGYRPGGIRDSYTAGQGLLNYLSTPAGQTYRQQQEDWVRAKLRKESGAVIGDDEMEREISVYFPKPGDGPDVIAQKAESRQRALQQMEISAARATQSPRTSQPQTARPTTQAEFDALPSGATYIDPDDGRTYRKP